MSYKNTALVLIIIIYFAKFPAFADEKLGLRDAIASALENNNKYKISHEKTAESNLRVRESWGKLWPELSSDAAVTRYWADQGTMSRSDGQYDIKFVKCYIAVNPGIFYNSLKASQDDHIISVNDERRVKSEITIQTIRLYYKILLSSEIVKMRTDSIKALEENLRVVEAGYKTGSYTKLDYLRAKVAAANEKTRLIMAQDDYQSAIAAMNINIGKNIDYGLLLDSQAIIANMDGDIEFSNWTEGQIKNKLTSMAAESFKNRPEIVELKYKKEMTGHRAKAAESVYLWPTLYINGSYGMNEIIGQRSGSSTGDTSADLALRKMGEISNPSGWTKSWTVTFGATYRWGSLLPLDSSHAKADQLGSQKKQADLEAEDFAKNVCLDIQQWLFKLKSASSAILSQKENIESAEESLRVAVIQFKNGMIDNTKFLDVNVELSNAKSMYFHALYDLQSSKAELNKAVGYDYFNY
jgi:outer membrane protein